jgi:dipeptidyl aminopeptidase/acylaminoacyl peptidase
MFVILLLLITFIISVSVYIITISSFIILKPFRKDIKYFQKKGIITDPKHYYIEYDDVIIDTLDNKKLKGWFLKSKERKALIIFFHGVSDSRYSHLSFFEHFVKYGFDILAYDLRAHGESTGNFCTYGFYEKKDTESAIKFLEKNGYITNNSIIGLMGISLGAAIALQSINIDNRIKFCVAEAPFSNLSDILDDYQFKGFFKLTKLYNSFIRRRIEKVGNFKISSVQPKNNVTNFKGKILLIHGDKDEKINIKYHYEILKNGFAIESFVLKGAGHNNLREIGGKEYINRILLFMS